MILNCFSLSKWYGDSVDNKFDADFVDVGTEIKRLCAELNDIHYNLMRRSRGFSIGLIHGVIGYVPSLVMS
jgi:hypothetical protein